MNTGAAVFLVLLGLAVFGFNLWLFIVGIQYLRTGTRMHRAVAAHYSVPEPSPAPAEPSPHTVWRTGGPGAGV